MTETLQCIFCFFLGYAIARLDDIKSAMSPKGPQSFLTSVKSAERREKAKLDESVFVTDVKTDTFEKSFNEIAKTTSTQDSVDSSVSKLAKLKKR